MSLVSSLERQNHSLPLTLSLSLPVSVYCHSQDKEANCDEEGCCDSQSAAKANAKSGKVFGHVQFQISKSVWLFIQLTPSHCSMATWMGRGGTHQHNRNRKYPDGGDQTLSRRWMILNLRG